MNHRLVVKLAINADQPRMGYMTAAERLQERRSGLTAREDDGHRVVALARVGPTPIPLRH